MAPQIGGAASNVESDPNLDATCHLGSPSAASDIGPSTDAPPTDRDADARPQGGGYDVGADEAG